MRGADRPGRRVAESNIINKGRGTMQLIIVSRDELLVSSCVLSRFCAVQFANHPDKKNGRFTTDGFVVIKDFILPPRPARPGGLCGLWLWQQQEP